MSWQYICVLRGGGLPVRLQTNPKLSHLIFKGANKIIAPSAFLQQKFSEHGYKVEIIPNPLNLPLYVFNARKKIRPRLLWVRAFDVTYNPFMAIYVLSELTKIFTDVQLCIVGPNKDGSMDVCKDLARNLGLVDKLIITGMLAKEEWISLSSEYDIFINTTNFDNTPVSVLEAMALGMPVISTNVGGMKYIIVDQKNGLLVNPGDVDGMVNAIKRLLADELLVEGISKEGRYFAETLDVVNIGKKWKNMIDEAIH
jgi:glycosyltransferase involved in cell wall biosynthesis